MQRIRVGGVPEHFNYPWQVALSEGVFEAAGLDVRYTDFPGGTGAMASALAEDELDLAMLLSEGALANAVRNRGYPLLKTYVRSPLIWGIHVASASSIKSIEQTRGARIAVSRMGSGSHLMSIVDAEQRQWPIKDMRFVLVGDLDGARSALASGKADVFFWEKYTTNPLVLRGEFRRVGECITPWPAFSVVGRDKFVQRHKTGVRRALTLVDACARKLMRRKNIAAEIATFYKLEHSDAAAWCEHVRFASGFRRPKGVHNKTLAALRQCAIISDEPVPLAQIWAQL